MPDIDLDRALSTAVNHLADLAGPDEDPNALATALEAAGITGRMNDTGQCPLARWLSKNLDGATLTVDADEIYAVHAPTVQDFQEAVVDLPDVLWGFIRRFDKGEYPVLVQGGLYGTEAGDV
ncbi:hypothetical protein ACIBI0_38540 [Microbispora rosea]|uniref:hypothetical protein n=1 Tax=Microbispora rosea TaxID=58117 RepID=UPI0037B637DF